MLCTLLGEAAPTPQCTDGPNNLDGKHRLPALEPGCCSKLFSGIKRAQVTQKPVLAEEGECGEVCAPPKLRAYGIEWCLGRDIRLDSCKSLL